MSDELDAIVRQALEDSRLNVSLEFRVDRDGSRSGEVVIREPAGDTVARIPVESPEAMNVALARLVLAGFREAVAAASSGAPPTRRERPSTDAPVLVAGVDGFRRGWVAVALDPSGDVEVSTHATFDEVLASRAGVIAVDIPIDPPGLGSRPTDAAARALVGGARASSVFPTPPRAALEARTFAEACEVARTVTGKGISQQAFALGRKILEVQAHADRDERVIEIHPEVSFCELAGGPLPESKHTAEGLARRRRLLAEAGIELPAAVPGVPEADLLDAAAGAWTAARYAAGTAETVPPEHGERLGAIWR